MSQSIGKKAMTTEQVQMLTSSEEFVPLRHRASPPLPSQNKRNLSKSKSSQLRPLVHSVLKKDTIKQS